MTSTYPTELARPHRDIAMSERRKWTQRGELLTELEKAPAAASRTTPGSTAGVGGGRVRTTEEIVREAVAKLG